jgi:hypothetical protein
MREFRENNRELQWISYKKKVISKAEFNLKNRNSKLPWFDRSKLPWPRKDLKATIPAKHANQTYSNTIHLRLFVSIPNYYVKHIRTLFILDLFVLIPNYYVSLLDTLFVNPILKLDKEKFRERIMRLK